VKLAIAQWQDGYLSRCHTTKLKGKDVCKICKQMAQGCNKIKLSIMWHHSYTRVY